MSKVHVKTGDTVIVLSGKDKGKTGQVMAVSPKEGKVIVEKVNMVSKHVKPKKMGEQGGIIKAEGAMYASKVQIVCPRCKKPTRVAHKFYEDGSKGRVCAKCGEALSGGNKIWQDLKNIIQKKLHLLLCQSSPTRAQCRFLSLIKSLSM